MRFEAIVCSEPPLPYRVWWLKKWACNWLGHSYHLFLYTGLTFALVQSEGNTPVARDLSNISWMTGAISFLRSLSTEGLISSGAAALSGFKFDRSLTIPFR